MPEYEFIIGLTEHRFLGYIFQPFIIQKKERFYTIVQLVKPHDFNRSFYSFAPHEKELVGHIEKYSDEALTRRFSREKSVAAFYASLNHDFFEKQVSPYIDKCMMDVHNILMKKPVRLFKKEMKYSNLYDEDVIEIQNEYARPEFYFERNATTTNYSLKVFLGDQEILLRSRNLKVVTNNPCMLVSRNRILAFKQLKSKRLLPFFEKETISVPNTIEDKYYPGFVLNTIRNYEVRAKGFSIKQDLLEKTAVLSLEKNLQLQPVLVLFFQYGNEKFMSNAPKHTAVSYKKINGSFVFTKAVRDKKWENGIIQKINELGLQNDAGYFTFSNTQLLEPQNAVYFYVNWLNSAKPEIESLGIKVDTSRLGQNYFTGKQELVIETKSRGDWFDVYATVRFGEFRFPFIQLKKYILNQIREFELPNGEIAVLPEEWFAKYNGLIPFGKQKGERLVYEKHHFALLNSTLKQTDKLVRQKMEELVAAPRIKTAIPENLKATLRNYQEEGFNWMFGLYKNKMGACLADDMGLGKTLQALSLLLKLKRPKNEILFHHTQKHKEQKSLFDEVTSGEENLQMASLVVVPTSLVHNWVNEIKRFTPALKVYPYLGAKRKKNVEINKIASYYDIIVTTYGTVRNDSSLLATTEFFYLILDESQSIKNPASKVYKAVIALRSKHKLVITGTPIENALADLWSQMNFLNPGLLGSLAFFRRTFITPIEKHGNEEQQEKLQLIIRPFVLRRKKSEVAKDLPPLVEQTRYCPLEGEQQKMYDKEKSIIRNTILSSLENEGVSKSQFVVLQGITKLRQLASHPALFDKNTGVSSGKFEEIFRMLKNVVAEKHKVLIFSSFVKHLELIEHELLNQKIGYSKLTGQTQKREEVIQHFQNNENNRVFLISIKAGGVGLNLTEADYVFIIDPWWNPAVENQAINRAHRIGQNKNVFVYRFITENSIEEKIQKLKERKSALADKFINSNNPFKEISKNEILELFS